MYDVINYPQYDIQEEIDCEPSDEDSLSFIEPSNVQNVGSLTSNEPSSKTSFESLPAEALLNLLLYLDSPFDVVNLSGVNKFLNSFVNAHSSSLARQVISCVEFRGVVSNEEEVVSKSISKVTMNLTGDYYGSKRLWKSLCFKGSSIRDLDVEMFAPKLVLFDDCIIRLDNIQFTKFCLPSLANFIEKMVRMDYPAFRRELDDFEVQINNCSFRLAAGKDIALFINKMIQFGCRHLTINSVALEDYTKVCRSLSGTRLHQLDTFRFHSDDVTSNRGDTLKYLFEPFCRSSNRQTSKIVIDGIQIPLSVCEWVMVRFCCTPFYEIPPTQLRVVMSIHRSYTRQELFDMLKGVRGGVEKHRKRINHRLNHVYLELGMYEADVHLTQNQHCVIDVKLMEPKYKSGQKKSNQHIVQL